ncbi:cell cycle checkpoint protein RAD17 isoform X2 [Dendrobium catenatum]|uniref:cell cycle checkpoint protein RAD17 isoform X2 n=1 Tax=Dendrobium catenatum TaxID=906689 RepID=UPI0009F73601|nr:cell cycle checkpoint protein RAD17 isoform X2 [Dendrobium catenatum]
MGKRKPVVVLSSSDDEVARTRSTGRARGLSESSLKSLSAARKKTRSGKSNGGSDVRHSREAEAAKFAALSEDFCGCLQNFHLTRGNQCTKCKELWIDKYEPSSIAQLAVHKKKIEEVKCWLEDRLVTSKGSLGNTAVRVIASQLGAQLCEWTTPTPTLWQEHVHNINSGLRFVSKLDEFEAFVGKIGKYSLLCPGSSGASSEPNIILIDDLPVTNGRVAFERLKKCLTSLSLSAQLPIIILITEYHKVDIGENSTNHCEELVSFLERAGAHKVAFNPLTVNSIKKVLSMLCQEEKCDVTPEQIDQIAQASGGDIRNAITSLQYCCLRPDNLLISPVSTLLETNAKFYSDRSRLSPFTGLLEKGELDSTYFPCGRDETLSLFHALGKFLHNKRDADAFSFGSESLILKEKYSRKPLKMDAPETILSQAYGKARPVTDFLHENVLDFINDGSIDDAWLVTSYLSDADCLLGSFSPISRLGIFSDMYESQSFSQSVASSVAIRGVLFGNSQPLSSRWHTIRSPRLWQIENSAKKLMNQTMNEKFDAFNGFVSSMSQIITEYRPSIRWFNSHCKDRLDNEELAKSSAHSRPDDSEDGTSKEDSDDDIEDW